MHVRLAVLIDDYDENRSALLIGLGALTDRSDHTRRR